MTITQEEAATFYGKLRGRVEELYAAICGDVHAMARDAALNEEWQPVAARALIENTSLRATIETLQAERAAISAHLESVVTERDELRRRVMELEKRGKSE